MFKQSKVWLGSFALLIGACQGEGSTFEIDENGNMLEVISTPVDSDADGTQVAGEFAGSGGGGTAETVHTSGSIDRTNPFFQALGANLRTCETCHAADQGWTIRAKSVKKLFDRTLGLAPLFMLHDTGSRPDADISTLTARIATFQSTLVERGLIRFTRTIPATAEFLVASVDDPSGFSTVTNPSAFRRPSPTANQSKVAHTGWAGAPTDPFTAVAATSSGATRLHEQRVDPLPVETVNAMRDFQLGVVFAQSVDPYAGPLNAAGAKGGAVNLMAQPFHVGINDIQGLDPAGQPFTRKVFDIYDAWAPKSKIILDAKGRARAAIYRGQELFNSFEFSVSGVPGFNDLLGQPVVRATCSTCHNAPNVGSHSVYRMFDIGTADEPNCSPALPLLTLQNKTTGATRKVCDMGRGTGTGLWTDVGRFRAPPLRGLAARAPYFHDGQAKDIKAVVKYFDRRFNIGFSAAQKADLEAFLRAL
jgi:cytochrome c peroxidase